MKIKQWWQRFERWLLSEPEFGAPRPPALPKEVNEPGLWYQRTAQPIRDVLRIFLTGNPSLDTPEYTIMFVELLRGRMAQWGVAEADMDVRVYASYIAVEHRNPSAILGEGVTIILRPDFVDGVIQTVGDALGWKETPVPTELMSDQARLLLDEKFGWRWPLGR